MRQNDSMPVISPDVITTAATAAVSVPKTKKCNKCGRELPLTAYARHSKSSDGLQYACRECHSEYNKSRAAKPKSAKALGLGLKPKTDPNNPLSSFTARELLRELKHRGYEGEFRYTTKVNLSDL